MVHPLSDFRALTVEGIGGVTIVVYFGKQPTIFSIEDEE